MRSASRYSRSIPAAPGAGRTGQARRSSTPCPTAAAYGRPGRQGATPAVFRNEFQAKKALAAAGISVPREEIVGSAEDAVRTRAGHGYPVVLKIASEDIAHKTEIGGVALNLHDDDAVRQAYDASWPMPAQHAPQARIDGVLVAPMVRGGVELIVGISRDPVFGPVVMVGMGGIYAEILKDVAVQVAPVSEDEARRMIRSLKMFPLLDGARGQPKADVAAAARMVARLSRVRVPPSRRRRGDRHEPDPGQAGGRGRPRARRPDGPGRPQQACSLRPTCTWKRTRPFPDAAAGPAAYRQYARQWLAPTCRSTCARTTRLPHAHAGRMPRLGGVHVPRRACRHDLAQSLWRPRSVARASTWPSTRKSARSPCRRA